MQTQPQSYVSHTIYALVLGGTAAMAMASNVPEGEVRIAKPAGLSETAVSTARVDNDEIQEFLALKELEKLAPGLDLLDTIEDFVPDLDPWLDDKYDWAL